MRHRILEVSDWTYLKLANSVAGAWTENTVGNLTGAGGDQSDGSISMPLAGGKAVSSTTIPDWDDAVAVWAMWPLLAGRGKTRTQVTGDVTFAFRPWLHLVSALSKNDDVQYSIGVFNESTPTSGTVEGVFATVQGLNSLANPRTRGHTISNGVTAGETNSSGTSANLRGVRATFERQQGATAGTRLLWMPATAGVDSNGDRIATLGSDNANGVGPGDGPLYFGVCAWRLNAANANAVEHYPRILMPVFTVH